MFAPTALLLTRVRKFKVITMKLFKMASRQCLPICLYKHIRMQTYVASPKLTFQAFCEQLLS